MRNKPAALALLVALLLAVYLTTLSRSISGGDSGELVTVAYELGVAHPPGYPLHTLIGHGLTYLPFGSIAMRVNLGSALYATGCGILIWATLRRWLGDPWIAFFGAGLFCFSPSVWRYAIIAEVFALNNLCVAGLLFAALRYWQAPEPRWIYVVSAIAGLGLANHHSLVFALVPLLCCLAVRDWRPLLRVRTLLFSGGWFLLGLAPYAYLPWASSKRPLASWGDLTTWRGFLDHLLRREYGTFRLASTDAVPGALENLRSYLTDSLEQFLWVGVLLGAWGAIVTVARMRRSSDYGIVPLAIALFYAVTWHRLANIDTAADANREILSRFWQMPNLVLCVLAAKGLAEVARLAGRWRALVITAAVSLVAVQIGLHYRTENASRDTVVVDFGRSMLESLPRGSLFLVRGDVLVNAVRYLQHCEGARTDVVALPVDLLATPWIGEPIRRRHPEIRLPAQPASSRIEALLTLVDLNRGRPTYVGIPFLPGEEAELKRAYAIWHVGFAYRLVPHGEPYEFEDYIEDSTVYSRYVPPSASQVQGRPWAEFMRDQYWAREQNRAERLALQDPGNPRGAHMVALSVELLERIIEEWPDAPAVNWRTLGFACWKLSRDDPSHRARMVEALREYLARNPADPHAGEIEALIDSATP
jgi:hypothetical protein